ncbi:SRPBCC family protein [Kordiimonas gwangyangensis]|uniref:SRPBCC family protein n=1 Tax=Kordiimonas gwangyangensis TaxID=288022 RepID=UPI00036124AB|nr:SRPBCC domain-containing protein [Kordiimonas gwangyangensis]
MANICHTFSTNAPREKIMAALTTLEGLQGWWTETTTGNPAKGGTLTFRFGDNGGFDMVVKESSDGFVLWEVTEGPEDWVGTQLEFKVVDDNGQNRLMFRHIGWAEEEGFFHHCSTKWATFVLSMRDLVESGKGRPFPNDLKIEASGM